MEKSNRHVERGAEKKKITISPSRVLNVPGMESLIWEMPGHIHLSVLIPGRKGYFLSPNMSKSGLYNSFGLQ